MGILEILRALKTREDWEIRQGYQYFLPEYTIHTYSYSYLYHNYFAKLFGEKLSVFLCSESSNSTFLAAAIFEDSFQNILSGYTNTAKLLGLGRVPFLGAWMESWSRIFPLNIIQKWATYYGSISGPSSVGPWDSLGPDSTQPYKLFSGLFILSLMAKTVLFDLLPHLNIFCSHSKMFIVYIP